MTTTIQVPTRTTTSAPAPTAERQPVWRHGVAAAIVVPTLAGRLARTR